MMVIVILIFLAALAALGLPWSLTDCFVIVLDSKPSGLPDKTETLQTTETNTKDKENYKYI